MAIHTELEVYQLSRDLLRACTTLTRSMPRDYKATFGKRIFDECVSIVVLIQRANVARDKVPHLQSILESVDVVESLLRLSLDTQPPCLSPKQYAIGAGLCVRVGKQVNAWKTWARKHPPPGRKADVIALLREIVERADAVEALRNEALEAHTPAAPAA